MMRIDVIVYVHSLALIFSHRISDIKRYLRRSAQRVLDSDSINPQAELRPGTSSEKLYAHCKDNPSR